MKEIAKAFHERAIIVPIAHIVSQKQLTPFLRKGHTYRRIAASLEHIGMIEPVVVFPRPSNDYLLLDGHVRVDILKRRGCTEISAIVATDDEAYTYNKRVNHAPPVTQHFMILKALSHGVSEERIALALNVDVAEILKKRDMLDGICGEAVAILRNKNVTANAFAVLRKMKPLRQIEAAERMVASGTFSISFAKTLLMLTKPEALLEPVSSKKINAGSKEAKILLEQETEVLVRDLKAAEVSYGTDFLTLTIFHGYLERLLSNPRVEEFLGQHHGDILKAFRSSLTEARSLTAA